MNKKYGWTLVEIMVVLVFIMIISSFLMANFKPKTQNTRIQAYAAIKNVIKGLIAVDDKYQKTPPANNDDGIFYQNPAHTTAGTSTFCFEMADNFSLKESPNCTIASTTSSNRGTPNIVLPNGVEIYGIASSVKTVGDIKYKDIAIDVDGKRGSNKLGVDRFPLRIYLEDKLVLSVNCNEQTDGFFDWKNNVTYTSSDVPDHEYCKYGGKDFTTAINSKLNFLLDEEMITYDTYRAPNRGDNDTDRTKATEMVAFSQSLAASVCGTFGGRRYLSAEQCSKIAKKGSTDNPTYIPLKIYTKCVMDEMCDICSTSPSICPMKLDGSAQTNASQCHDLYYSPEINNVSHTCLFLLHKPASGMSAFIEGIVGDLDAD